LNKYYPPDFDPSKIPKLKLPKDRQYVVRLMAPFNMRCKTCGEYIYKGKKFNARKETVQNEHYMGLPIFRFYIKCTRCLAEITFKTDPENTDYAMEHGATRNFQAEKLIEEEERKIQKEREDEELNNPMKVLENRTRDSKMEMEVLENLQELKELNQRQARVDFEGMLGQYREMERLQREMEEEEDERETKEMLEKALVKRLRDSDSDASADDDGGGEEEEERRKKMKKSAMERPTDILTGERNTDAPSSSSSSSSSLSGPVKRSQPPEKWERSVGSLGSKALLGPLVVRKKSTTSTTTTTTDSKQTDIKTSVLSSTAGSAAKPTVPLKSSSTVEPKTVPPQNGSSSLSLLGAYSDSDDSD